MVALHLRGETKSMERRSALTPATARKLQDAGIKVYVERSTTRIFEDEEFEDLDISLVDNGSWKTAPLNRIIIGLKDLEPESFPLMHEHIYFGHCYKNQVGWEETLRRFFKGKGTLYDIEFLKNSEGRRVAAFGYFAGYAGAAVGVQNWISRIVRGKALGAVSFYPTDSHLVEDIKSQLVGIVKLPRVLVIGALGRCGTGAVALCRNIGLPEENIVQWDIAETSRGGPFREILEADVFVNCIYLSHRIPPFVTIDTLNNTQRRLRVIVDVSADTTNPHNPIPVCSKITSFESPTEPILLENGPSLDMISIDHFPSLLPREASESFAENLLPALLNLPSRETDKVWSDARELYRHHAALIH